MCVVKLILLYNGNYTLFFYIIHQLLLSLSLNNLSPLSLFLTSLFLSSLFLKLSVSQAPMASLSYLSLFLFLASSAILSCCLPSSFASHLYIVGGNKGWTIPSRVNLDYQQWASTISPQVNDSLEFIYNKTYHSVLKVTRSHYRYCNTSDPMASFQDGKTIIKLTNPGSYYFICGVPGHCEAGQKFMIRVANSTAVAPVASVPTASEPASEPSAGSEPASEPSATSEPASGPSAESLPPFVHAVPPTTGAATGVRSSMLVMVWGMILASALSVMMM